MARVLAVAEQKDGALCTASHTVVAAANDLAAHSGGQVDALLLGAPGLAAPAAELADVGAARVWAGEDEALGRYVPEVYAGAVAGVTRGSNYVAVLFAATSQGKDLAPRVAALLDVPLATDVTRLEMEGTVPVAVRPVFAGKAFARVRSSRAPFLASVRPGAFPARGGAEKGRVELFVPEVGEMRTRFREFRPAGGSVDVSEATVVVSGGRGMLGPERWGALEGLRDAIGSGCALGASRAVVDAGWRPHAEQVGQTGKTVSPQLYFAVGVSGATQHLAGMRTSGTIVAVNKDPDAPIFKAADYGIVGDLFEILPRLAEEIRALGRS